MATMGCTGKNPDFQDTEGPTSGEPTESTGTEGTTTDAQLGSESGPDTTVTPDESSSETSSSGEPPDCTLQEQNLLPIRDNFLVIGEMCGENMDLPCADISFGSTSSFFISGPDQDRVSYLLITFNLGGFDEIGDGILELRITEPTGSFTLQITPVFPGTWVEGFGDNGPAQLDASSWNWSMRPTEWVPDEGPEGTFQAVLDEAPPSFEVLVETPFDPPADVNELITALIPISADILADLDDFGRLNLAITAVGEINQLEVRAADSVSNSPRLIFSGC